MNYTLWKFDDRTVQVVRFVNNWEKRIYAEIKPGRGGHFVFISDDTNTINGMDPIKAYQSMQEIVDDAAFHGAFILDLQTYIENDILMEGA